MKQVIYPLEFFFILSYFLEYFILVDRLPFMIGSAALLALSFILEGARPYSFLLILVLILELFDFTQIQMVLILITVVLMMLLRTYHINVPEKGPYSIGHTYHQIEDGSSIIDIAIFYPGHPGSSGKRVKWVPNAAYDKVLYEIFFVDPRQKRIPFKLFKFAVSFMHRIFIPALANIRYFADENNQNRKKVIIFSHGLGAHMNCYSSFCGSLASLGYIVVCPNHPNDEVCLDFRKVSETDEELIRQFLYENRNRDLIIRRKEIVSVIESIVEKDILSAKLGEKVEIDEIILGGQSYGGGSAIETKAWINRHSAHKHLFNRLICLDPWLFPMNDQQYANLKNENLFIINSHHFYEKVPKAYQLQEKLKKLKQNSPPMITLMVKKTDHIGQSDFAYCFGGLLKLTKIIKLLELSDKLMHLNQLLFKQFLQGETQSSLIELGNNLCRAKGLHEKGVKVQSEYRYSRELTMKEDEF